VARLREERTRQSREALLSAAAELFGDEGYRATSLADVAQRSGVSRGSIPWHFGDKAGLLRAVAERVREDLDRGTATPLPAGRAGALEIAEFSATAVRAKNTRVFLALLHEAKDPISPIHDLFADMHASLRQHFRTWIERPEVMAGLPEDVSPTDLATAMVGAMIGINQQWSLNPGAVDVDAAHHAMVRTLFGFLWSPDPAAGRTGSAPTNVRRRP
jgi:TetR/AcrR family transcriptional regulator, acrAB operon repressor